MKRVLVILGSVVARVLLLVPALIAFGALLAPSGVVATALATVCGLAMLGALVLVRPLWKAAAVTLGVFAVVLVWFQAQTPSNDRDWQVDVSRPPQVAFEGDRVTIRNVRDFDWTGADTSNPRWMDRTLDLTKLDTVWLVLSYWDGNTEICHTMLSFGFTDGQQVAVSVEARKTVGEEYSTWRGFFHQFELIYVLAEERDVIGVRAAHRGEDLYLYPLRLDAAQRRRLLTDVLHAAESLATTAEWYGALRTNCTTTLQRHVDDALGRPAGFHWDTMLNGHIDEKGWRLGSFDDSAAGTGPGGATAAAGAAVDSRPFAEFRAAHRITDPARRAAGRPDFSRVIREAVRVALGGK